jgi:hypothetical protein
MERSDLRQLADHCLLSRKDSVVVACSLHDENAYKAATRPKMARIPAPVAVRAEAAPSKGAASEVDEVGAPVPEGAGAAIGVVPLDEG